MNVPKPPLYCLLCYGNEPARGRVCDRCISWWNQRKLSVNVLAYLSYLSPEWKTDFAEAMGRSGTAGETVQAEIERLNGTVHADIAELIKNPQGKHENES